MFTRMTPSKAILAALMLWVSTCEVATPLRPSVRLDSDAVDTRGKSSMSA
jgi:hypothetical protein